jgi:hypothetical protein
MGNEQSTVKAGEGGEQQRQGEDDAHLHAEEEAAQDATRAKQMWRLYDEYQKQFPEVNTMSAEEVYTRVLHPEQHDEELILVDVRQESERALSMIPSAISLQVSVLLCSCCSRMLP